MSMMMRPVAVWRCKIRFDRVFLSGSMPHQFAAFANALIRLDMRTRGYFLQIDRDRLGAFDTFEREATGGFVAHSFLDCEIYKEAGAVGDPSAPGTGGKPKLCAASQVADFLSFDGGNDAKFCDTRSNRTAVYQRRHASSPRMVSAPPVAIAKSLRPSAPRATGPFHRTRADVAASHHSVPPLSTPPH
jgi:hypothetical protein